MTEMGAKSKITAKAVRIVTAQARIRLKRPAERGGYFKMSHDLLSALLCLPKGTVIERVSENSQQGDPLNDCFTVIVRGHGELPVVKEGTYYPQVCPAVERRSDGELRFLGWEPGGFDRPVTRESAQMSLRHITRNHLMSVRQHLDAIQENGGPWPPVVADRVGNHLDAAFIRLDQAIHELGKFRRMVL